MRAATLVLAVLLTLVPGNFPGPEPIFCTPPPCGGVLVCADDAGCDCQCLPGF